MGNVCEPREEQEWNDRTIQLQRRLEPRMSISSPYYSKLKHIESTQNCLSQSAQEKQILNLIDIRQQVVQEMLDHVVICGHQELVSSQIMTDTHNFSSFNWINDSNSHYESWNPQDCHTLQETTCERGIHLNECMRLCCLNLEAFKYTEQGSDYIYVAFIMKY